MKNPHTNSALGAAVTVLFTTIVVGASQQASPPAQEGMPATIPASVAAAAEKIANDSQVLALIKDQSTDAAAKARWNQFLELVRIPSPPRQELLKAAEIHRRLVNEWGFTPAEVMTRADGIIAGTDTNIIAILRGEHMLPPRADTLLSAGDRLIVVGDTRELERLGEHLEPW